MTRKIIHERSAGTRTILNTQWPMVDQLIRDQRPGGKPTWQVVYGLCNGIPDSVEIYQTKFGAERAFANLLVHGADAYPETLPTIEEL